jgi:hypothetical protein
MTDQPTAVNELRLLLAVDFVWLSKECIMVGRSVVFFPPSCLLAASEGRENWK